MQLRAGQKLHSTVSEAQVVVVKAPEADVEIACGGAPMTEEPPAAPAASGGDLGDGPLLGKRYADEELGLELLCSKPGAGSLTVDGREIPIKGAKPLPSSD